MKKVFLPLLALLFLGGMLRAQTLDEVLAKYYQARGGLEKLRAVKARKMSGKILLTAQGLEMRMVIWQKHPDKMRVETLFQDKKIIQAFDGRKTWWIMPFLSEDAQEMPPEQGRQFRDQAEFEDPLLVYKAKGYPLELLGEEELRGTPVFKLKLTKANGKVIYFYLDAGSGIELESSWSMKAGESETRIEILYGNYRPVDGILMPLAIVNKVDGKIQVQMALEAIEMNPALEDALFAMPEKKESPKPTSGGRP